MSKFLSAGVLGIAITGAALLTPSVSQAQSLGISIGFGNGFVTYQQGPPVLPTPVYYGPVVGRPVVGGYVPTPVVVVPRYYPPVLSPTSVCGHRPHQHHGFGPVVATPYGYRPIR